jgi:hypothetical protein
MFEFIKKKVTGMVDKKISPKKKIPAKKENLSVEGVVAQRVVAKDYPKNLCIGKDNKTFLTIEEDGSMVFNKNDFPEWKVDNFAREFVNFAREFVNIVEEISKKM